MTAATLGHNGEPAVSGRYILFHVDWRDHPLVGRHNPEYFTWWVDLLCECNYADGQIRVNGFHFDLRPGEMVGAISFLGHRWGVGARRVRTFIDHLVAYRLVHVRKRDTQSDKQKGKAPQVISINNYSDLVNGRQAARTSKPTSKPTIDRQATDTQPTRNNKQYKQEQTETNIHTHTVGPNEQEVSHGIIFNCETVRHKDGYFALSIPSIELATQGTVPRDRVEAIVKGYALQWGLEIEAGKDPRKVIPNDAMSYVAAQVRKEFTRPIDAEFRRKRADTAAQKQKTELAETWKRVLEEESGKIGG